MAILPTVPQPLHKKPFILPSIYSRCQGERGTAQPGNSYLSHADGEISFGKPDFVPGKVPSRANSCCHDLHRCKAAVHQARGKRSIHLHIS